jgi:hypothetical protein
MPPGASVDFGNAADSQGAKSMSLNLALLRQGNPREDLEHQRAEQPEPCGGEP